jgi:hypothetical protein
VKLRTFIATAAVAVAALVPATTASAFAIKVWTPYYAANQVAGSTLHWTNDAPDYVTYAECRGVGRAYYFYGDAHFYRLNCYVETADSEQFVIRVVVKGDHAFKYRFLRWA